MFLILVNNIVTILNCASVCHTTQGLSELWEYKQKHPDVDLNPQLKTLPAAWQTSIERGLSHITAERQAKNQPPTTGMPALGWGLDRGVGSGCLTSRQKALGSYLRQRMPNHYLLINDKNPLK